MKLLKRWLLIGFGLIIVPVSSWAAYPVFVPPSIPFVNFQPEQGEETALRHLQLAHQYYYNRDVNNALEELSKAALSSQDEIAKTAREQIDVIKNWQASPYYWAWSLGCWIWRNSIWILIVVVLLVLYLFQPIKNPRFILENIELLGLSPQNLQPAHILLEDLYLARQTIHNMRGSFLFSPMNMAMPQVIKSDQMIENLLNHFGKFKFSLIETEPSKLINTLRRLFNKKDIFINGSLIFQEKKIVLRVFTWQKGKIINSFCLSKNSSDNEKHTQTVYLLEEAASRLWYELTPGIPMNSSENLMVFVRALHEYQENLSGKENFESLQEAYLALEQAVLNDSANLTLRFLLGLILNSLGKFRQARPHFEWIIKESDQETVRLAAYYNLAMAEYSCFTERENKQAEKNFTTILEMLDSNQRKLQRDQIILMALAHCGLASVLGQRFHLKNWNLNQDLTEPEFQKQIDGHCETATDLMNNPELPENEKKIVKTLCLYASGTTAYFQAESIKDINEQSINLAQQAEKHLSAVLKIQPGHIPAMIYLALAKHIIGQSADEVIGLLKLAGKSRTAGSPYAWFRLALLLEKEQPEQALLFYENSGDFPNSLVNAGRLLAKEGKYFPAMEKYKRALDLNPKLYEAYNEIAWRTFTAFEKNEIEITPGDLFYARNAAEKALEFCSNRDKSHAFHILGLMQFATRQFIEAKNNFQQAIFEKINSINKVQAQYYYYYAKVLVELQDKNGAFEQINKALISSKTSDEYYQKSIQLKNILEEK